MSFNEYWSEQYDPRPVGNVELNTEHVAQRSEWAVFFKLITAALIAAGLFWLPFHFLPLTGWHSVVVAAGVALIYVGLAFFFVPQAANNDNLGWQGAMVDDPFHVSEDWNRSLMFFHAILGPGRFIAGTLLDVACLLGVTQSDPDPLTYEYHRQPMDYAEDYTTANVTMTELPSEQDEITSSGISREEANQKRFELASARFLINDDE